MTVKDVFDTQGMPATNGLAFLRDNRPTEDAALVARLKAAGAIVFGKTSLPVGSYDWQCVHPIRVEHRDMTFQLRRTAVCVPTNSL